MKKLSIEEKAKAYDAVREKIAARFGSNVAEEIFSEFEDSENEKVRKALIEYFRWNVQQLLNDFSNKDVLAWLERQGEEKIADKVESMEHSYITTNSEFFQWIYDRLRYVYNENPNVDYMLSLKERIEDMQKSTDNLKPKFKVGDWITDGHIHCRISDVLDDRYIVDTKFAKRSAIPFKRENDYHLWTIDDAKDGDIICVKNAPFIYWHHDSRYIYSYCTLNFEGEFLSLTPLCWDIVTYYGEIFPATKEQCNLLFQKMKEAGYEWDNENKQLNKIGFRKHLKYNPNSPSITEQKTDWSEDDENTIKVLMNIIRNSEIIDSKIYTDSLKEKLYDWLKSLKPQPKREWNEEDEKKRELLIGILNVNHPNGHFKVNPIGTRNMEAMSKDELVSWLKSLKERATWKPSDEQMNAFKQVYDWYNTHFAQSLALNSLYYEMKKLKGE